LVALDHLLSVAETDVPIILVVIHAIALNLKLHLLEFVIKVHDLNITVDVAEAMAGWTEGAWRKVVKIREVERSDALAKLALDDEAFEHLHDRARADPHGVLFQHDLYGLIEYLTVDIAHRWDEFGVGLNANVERLEWRELVNSVLIDSISNLTRQSQERGEIFFTIRNQCHLARSQYEVHHLLLDGLSHVSILRLIERGPSYLLNTILANKAFQLFMTMLTTDRAKLVLHAPLEVCRLLLEENLR
jgi:hypothetical protein